MCSFTYSTSGNPNRNTSKTDVTPAILSRDKVIVYSCACRPRPTATSSHKQELTNQRSPHLCDKVAQNRALLYSEKELCDC